jgi:hypothetical protein
VVFFTVIPVNIPHILNCYIDNVMLMIYFVRWRVAGGLRAKLFGFAALCAADFGLLGILISNNKLQINI